MGQNGVGQPVSREEDPYLLRGAGRYVDDVRVMGTTFGVVLRSMLMLPSVRSTRAPRKPRRACCWC